MQAAPCIPEIYRIEYFKLVFLNIYNCTYKTPFRKSSHICACMYTCIHILSDNKKIQFYKRGIGKVWNQVKVWKQVRYGAQGVQNKLILRHLLSLF